MSRRGTVRPSRELLAVIMAFVLAAVLYPVISPAQLLCNDCHGTRDPADNRPLDTPGRDVATGGFPGNHRNHMPDGANPGTCAVCHPGSAAYNSAHRDGNIRLAGNINSSPDAAVYHNRTSAFPQTSTPDLGTCTSVNCHFEKETPRWGNSTLTPPTGCTVCHGAPPGSYSGDLAYPGYLQTSSRNGTCSGIYCHSNGAPFDRAEETRTVTWGGPAQDAPPVMTGPAPRPA